ncbi:uncharacterized protein LOC118562568 [Fundulus heteroclitus]|uniref:uncharacterized protein LOC118562568 n=1 Tax=Fundulus heteroclitus TaxID=8078 RepID=UPI00165A9AA2|nr:uncharacterized protein LOC118562568 [Fundulus heteroclitus]
MEEAVRGSCELRIYSSAEREAMDRLSRKILKRPLDERYQPPGSYTGELLGMEYLYSQSGRSLTVMDNPEEEDRLVELMDDEAVRDEGFVEEEPEDLTVPVLFAPEHSSVQQASSPSSSAPSTSSRGDPCQLLNQSPLPPPGPSPCSALSSLLYSLLYSLLLCSALLILLCLLLYLLPCSALSSQLEPLVLQASAGSSVADQAPAAVLGPDGIPGLG